ncbi:(2Fe-2S)-binding protein, partial [Methylobacterium organophilum]|nr:(2Fe-2S)-binding protein [Methylobacterium organophilum]
MVQLTINARRYTVDAEPDTPLLFVLRDSLGLTGTKYGCGIGQCGACTVLLDGAATRSCLVPLESVGDQAITTIEAIEQDPVGARVVAAWVGIEVPQCGYCQSGQVMAATSLLKQTPKPTEADIAGAEHPHRRLVDVEDDHPVPQAVGHVRTGVEM